MFALAFIVLAVADFGASQTLDDCPEILERNRYLQVYGDSCFQFVLYRHKEYVNAEKDCEKNGGTLALIKSPDVQNYIYNQLVNSYLYRSKVWIGLSDRFKENTWVWEDRIKMEYSNWDNNQGPSHGSGLVWSHYTDDCALMDLQAGGKWHDYSCESKVSSLYSHAYAYICQYKLTKLAASTTTTSTTTASATTTTATSTTIPTTVEPTTTLATTTPTPSTTILATPEATTIPTTTITPTTPAPTTTLEPTTIIPPTTSETTTILPTGAPQTQCPPPECSLNCTMDEYQKNQGASLTLDDCPPKVPRDQYLQLYGDSCFQFDLNHLREYPDARRECRRNGGTLAMVKSKDIQDFLLGYIKEAYHRRKSIWIGLTDEEEEYKWKWEDGTPVTYNNWADGKRPGDPGRHYFADCGAMDPITGIWTDENCQNSLLQRNYERPYICQYQLCKTTTSTTSTTPTTTTTTPATTIMLTPTATATSTTKPRATATPTPSTILPSATSQTLPIFTPESATTTQTNNSPVTSTTFSTNNSLTLGLNNTYTTTSTISSSMLNTPVGVFTDQTATETVQKTSAVTMTTTVCQLASCDPKCMIKIYRINPITKCPFCICRG